MAGLFDKLQLKDLELKNRIVMAPMCMDVAKEGYTNDWHFVHYTTRAIGGVGLILLEATAVSSEGRITPDDLGLWHEGHKEGLKRIVDGAHAHGAKVGIQLSHAGRKAELKNELLLAPSALAFSEAYKVPEAMSHEDIKRVVKDFARASKWALEVGFDVIEIHGAHGYLINQFMSPLTNKRTDEYGGSLGNRSRFLGEVVEAVRSEWPASKPLMLRISGEEYDFEGQTTEEIAELINAIKKKGVDVIDVSSGGVVPCPIVTYPGYQLQIGEKIKNLTELKTVVGGLVTEAAMAEEIVRNERGDLVYLGRELLRNPYWALQAAKQLGVDVEWPVPYERSKVVRKSGF